MAPMRQFFLPSQPAQTYQMSHMGCLGCWCSEVLGVFHFSGQRLWPYWPSDRTAQQVPCDTYTIS